MADINFKSSLNYLKIKSLNMNTIKCKRNFFLLFGKIIISAIQYGSILFNVFDSINIISFILLHAIYYCSVNNYFENDLFIEENYLIK